MNTGGIVLAGGRSSRLGRDKAVEMVAGRSLLQRAVAALRELCNDVIVVGRKSGDAGAVVRWVEDIVPAMGPLGGIYTGLAVAPHEQNLVVACDMPFLRRDLLEVLITRYPEADVVVPVVDGQMQPLCARYAVRCLHPIDELIREGHFGVMKLFHRVHAEFVEFDDEQPFIDVDTVEDLEKAKRIAEG